MQPPACQVMSKYRGSPALKSALAYRYGGQYVEEEQTDG
jgi:hypothetical protein